MHEHAGTALTGRLVWFPRICTDDAQNSVAVAQYISKASSSGLESFLDIGSWDM